MITILRGDCVGKKCPKGHDLTLPGALIQIRAPEKGSSQQWRCKKCQSERFRVYWRYKMYGVTVEFYDYMLTQQHGKCAICGNPETDTLHGKVKTLAVNHNHVTGKYAGCYARTAIGVWYVRGRPDRLMNAR